MPICPECQTSQPAEAPFCSNCGYRIRRHDTMHEGVGAVSEAMMADYLQNGGASLPDAPRPDTPRHDAPRHDTSRATPARHAGMHVAVPRELSVRKQTVRELTPDDGPELRAGDPTPVELEAAPAGHLADHLAGRQANDEHDSTVLEGLRAVGPADLSGEFGAQGSGAASGADRSRELAANDDGPAAPAARSSLLQAPRPKLSRTRIAVFVALWFLFTAMGILVGYFTLERRMGSDARDVPWSVAEASRRVPIAEGPFRRGLSEEVRSFILQSCLKFHEDPDDACEQDKLLRGEYPQTTVELAGYAIDSKEVTVAQYDRCVDAGHCQAPDYRQCAVWTPQGLQIALRVPRVLQDAAMPQVCVTRAEARSYCQHLGGDLPTHDQWEKAARGPDGNLFPWGDAWSADLANWGERDLVRTLVVGKLDGHEWTAPPGHYPDGTSPHGLFDMAGNVSEWVTGPDPLVGHARGGSWISNPFDLRTTGRLELEADARRTDVGFRCAY